MNDLIKTIFKTLFFFDLGIIVLSVLPEFKFKNAALNNLCNMALCAVILIVFTVVFLKIVEKKTLRLSAHPKKSAFLKGIGIGILFPAVILGIMFLFKVVSFSPFQKPEKITELFYYTGALFCCSLACELLLRGYLFRLYKKHYGFLFSTVVTTLLFISFNLEIFKTGKIYSANIILINILLCFLLEYTRSFAAVVLARFFYSVITCIVLGTVSTSSQYPVFFNLVFSGKKLITGPENGFEASIITLIITSVITILLLNRKYNLLSRSKDTVIYLKKQFKNIKRKRNKVRVK